jgi:hypothetical protein
VVEGILFFGKGGCVDCERNGTVCESVEYIVNKKRGVLDSSLCLCSIKRFLLRGFGQGTLLHLSDFFEQSIDVLRPCCPTGADTYGDVAIVHLFPIGEEEIG